MPDISGDSARFGRNVSITYNVLAVSSKLNIRKVVIGSSLAIYGFYYPLGPALPDYLPIDEDHPRRPEDPYGLSKLMGEEICESFTRRGAMQVASLRFAGIANTAVYERLLERRDDPMSRGFGSLWSYVDVRDAANACCAALGAEFDGHQAFNILAPNTYLTIPTRQLLDQFLPEVRHALTGQDGFCCGFRLKVRPGSFRVFCSCDSPWDYGVYVSLGSACAALKLRTLRAFSDPYPQKKSSWSDATLLTPGRYCSTKRRVGIVR